MNGRATMKIQAAMSIVTDESMHIYSSALKEAIKELGSVKQLAHESGISLSTLYRILHMKSFSLQKRTYLKLFHFVAKYLPDEHTVKISGKNKHLKINHRKYVRLQNGMYCRVNK